MIQAVFGDSEKGSLRCAVHWSPSGGEGIAGLVFQSAPNGKTISAEEEAAALARIRERQDRADRTGKRLEGKTADIVGLGFGLDMGDISGPTDGPARRAFLERVLDRDDYGTMGEDDPDPAGRYWDGLTGDLRTLLDRAGRGEPVRFWISDNPGSLCGFYDALWNLRDCGCPVTVVRLPRWIPGEGGAAVSHTGWGEVSPGEWAHFEALEEAVPPSIRRAVVMEWERLKRENAPLRAVVNGRLVSVEEDFYDFFLRREIPDGTFRVAGLIGSTLGRNRLGIGDWWLARRVRRMLDAGELVLVKRGEVFYRSEVRRACAGI